MLIRNTSDQFGWIARIVHWIVAVLMIGLTWLGWYMVDLSYYDAWYMDALVTHRALGLLVLVLAVFKALWMIASPTPKPLHTVRPWEQITAELVHWILFLSLFLIPATGYVVSTSEGAAIPFFDWFDVPALFTVDASTRDLAIEIHFYAAYAILGVIAVHAGAALKHHFLDRDDTLKRML